MNIRLLVKHLKPKGATPKARTVFTSVYPLSNASRLAIYQQRRKA